MPFAGSGGRRVRTAGNPWQGVADAAQSIAQQFSDPEAMEGMNAAATAHHAIKALGDALSAVGKTTVDTVKIDPRVASYMEHLGQYVLKAVQPTEEMGSAIRKAHADKIQRIEEGDAKEAKWDISANSKSGGGGGGARRPA